MVCFPNLEGEFSQNCCEDRAVMEFFRMNPKLTLNLNLENNHQINQSYEYASTQDHEVYYQS